jgi:hypothetical protein
VVACCCCARGRERGLGRALPAGGAPARREPMRGARQGPAWWPRPWPIGHRAPAPLHAEAQQGARSEAAHGPERPRDDRAAGGGTRDHGGRRTKKEMTSMDDLAGKKREVLGNR